MPIFQNKIIVYGLIVLAVIIIAVLSYFAFFSPIVTTNEVVTWNGDTVRVDKSVKLKSSLFSDPRIGEINFDSESKTFLLTVEGTTIDEQESNMTELENQIQTILKIDNKQLCSLFISVTDKEGGNLYLPSCLVVDQE